MLFVKKKEGNFVRFEDLKVGDCFLYDDNVLIKINDFTDQGNSFNFTQNCMCIYHQALIVKKINCKLVEI